MQEVGWPSLSSRRKQHKLLLFYKIKTGVYPDYIRRLIPEPVPNRYQLRVNPYIPPIHTRLVTTGKTYIPSTIKLWNKLPANTVASPTFSIFKKIIMGNPIKRNQYNTLCTGRPGIWLSRLRMGLSALCHHRFTYNLVDSSACPTCGCEETTSHYLFYCNTYAAARTTLYNSLAQLGIDVNNKTQLLQTILHGTIDYHKDLLAAVYQYLGESKRFK